MGHYWQKQQDCKHKSYVSQRPKLTFQAEYKIFKLKILTVITHRLYFVGDTRLDTRRRTVLWDLGAMLLSICSLFMIRYDNQDKSPCQAQQISRTC